MQNITTAAKAGALSFFIAMIIAPNVNAESSVFYGIQFEQLEYRLGDTGDEIAAWDIDVFVATDELKARWVSEGEYQINDSLFEGLENQFLLQKPISDFFDVKGGVRYDSPDGPNRWYGVVGLSGLAPQWIEVDTDLFMSEKGDASLRLDAEYELLITNELIFIPSIEINYAFSEDTEISSGTGFNDAELGFRLSYDLLDRAVSPYIGTTYEQKFGDTADFARDESEDTKGWSFVVGTRLLF